MAATTSSFVQSVRQIMWKDSGVNGDAQRIEQLIWILFLKVYSEKEKEWKFEDPNWTSIIPEECQWQNWAHDDFTGKAITGDKLLDFVNIVLFPVLKGKNAKTDDGKEVHGITVTDDTLIKKSIVKTTFEDANNYMKDGVLLRQVINIVDGIDFGDFRESHAFGDIYEQILKELQGAGDSGEFYTPRAVTEFMAETIEPQIGEKMADFACGTGGFLTSWLKELGKKAKSTADREALGKSIYGIEKKPFPYMLCVTNMLLHDVDEPNIVQGNSLGKNVLDFTEKDKFDVILMNPPFGGSEKENIKSHFPANIRSSETYDLFMAVIMYRLKKNGRVAVVLPDGFLFGIDNSARVNLKKKLIEEYNLHTIIRLPGSIFSPYATLATNIIFFENTHPTKETWFYRVDMPKGYKHFSKTKPIKPEHLDCIREWWNNRQEIEDKKKDENNSISYKSKAYTPNELADLGYNLDLCGFPQEEKIILSPEETISNFVSKRETIEAQIDKKLEELKALLEVE